MPYVVKWRLLGEIQHRQSRTQYTVPSAAIEFACTILKQFPLEIWIEGPSGVRIERHVIIRHCSGHRPLQT